MAFSRESRMPLALGVHGAAIYLFLYLPIALLIFFSFNRNPSGTFPITGLTLDWYRQLGSDFFLLSSFQTSLILALTTVPIATFVGTLCAFGLVRSDFRFKALFSGFVLMPMVVPGILLGAAILVVLRTVFGVPLSIWTAVMGHAVVTTPYAVLAVATRLYGYERILDAAAADLGATPIRAFW